MKKQTFIIDNVIMMDNDPSENPLSPYNIQDAVIIKMNYESNDIFINIGWKILKYFLRRDGAFDEAFEKFEQK